GAGPGGGPHVRIFDPRDQTGRTIFRDYFAFDRDYTGGVEVGTLPQARIEGIPYYTPPDRLVFAPGRRRYDESFPVATGEGGLMATAIGFLGAGQMATALAKGWTEAGLLDRGT